MSITGTIIMILISYGLVGGIFFVGIGTLIYYEIYKHIINRRLANGITDKKLLLSPKWVAVILLILHLISTIPLLIAPLFVFEERQEMGQYANETTILFASDTEDFFANSEPIENAQFAANSAVRNGIDFTYSTVEVDGRGYYIANIAPQQAIPADTPCEIEVKILRDDGRLCGGLEGTFTAEDFPVCIASPFHEEEFDGKMEITVYVLSEEGVRSVPAVSTVMLPAMN